MLQEVVSQQAQLVARWQLVGFVHGVMNTDNIASDYRPSVRVVSGATRA